MRAIIDADRLPTAVRYYREYMSEPAPLLAPPITIDSGKFSPTSRLTLMSLLTAIESAGEKEYLVVLHSNPDGLVLPVGIGQSSTITADKSVLTAIRLASLAFDLMDDTTTSRHGQEQRAGECMDGFLHQCSRQGSNRLDLLGYERS
jgi:hypothetical protein